MMNGHSLPDEMDQDLELALKLSLECSQNEARNRLEMPGPSNRSNVSLGNFYENRKRPVELSDRSPVPKRPAVSKEHEDYLLALKLSEEINGPVASPVNSNEDDLALALRLENENKSSDVIVLDEEDVNEDFLLAIRLSEEDLPPDVAVVNSAVPAKFVIPAKSKNSQSSNSSEQSSKRNYGDQSMSVVDPSWETIDPVPDIYALFAAFNKRFFWGKLESVEVKWSPRMTQCAGVCSYSPRAGFCSVRLSQPLLKFRPRKDLVETMLHEMIHAFLFVTRNDRDRDGHGPRFCEHMNRINTESGAHITIYHSFHEEVKHYKTHWWKCNGPCQQKSPYFGFVKRSTNRAPGPNDCWWNDHRASCGGEFIKVKEPENYVNKKQKKKDDKKAPVNVLDNYFPSLGTTSSYKPPSASPSQKPPTASTSQKQPTSLGAAGFKKYAPVLVPGTASGPATPNNPNRGQKILSLVDLNVKKNKNNSLMKSPNQSSGGPNKSKFVPLPGQQRVFRFINDNDW